MSANFRKGMPLSQISADELNRVRRASLRPPQPIVGRTRDIYKPANQIITGINATGTTLNNGSIVAIDTALYQPQGGDDQPDDPDLEKDRIYQFVSPYYPQPQPDEDGKTEWEYPEQRMAVIQTSLPVENDALCYALLYGRAVVKVRMNENVEVIRYATFVDGDTTRLQLADVGPAEIIEYGSDEGGDSECTIYFPMSAQAEPPEDGGEGEGGEGGGSSITGALTIGIVTQRSDDGAFATVQPMKWDFETQKYVPDGGAVQAVTVYGLKTE